MRIVFVLFMVILYNPIYSQTANDYSKKGDSKMLSGDFFGAVEEYGKALEIEPQNISALYNRGQCRFNLEEYTSALSDFDKVIEIEPNNADAYYKRSLTNVALKDYQSAIYYLGLVIAIKPDEAEAYYLRGMLNLEKNYNIEACKDLHRAAQYGHTKAEMLSRELCK